MTDMPAAGDTDTGTAHFDGPPSLDVLDDPVGASLRGQQAHLARRLNRAAAYLPDVATFAAMPAEPTPADWAALAQLLGPGQLANPYSATVQPPDDWAPVWVLPGVQMIAPASAPDAQSSPQGRGTVIELGTADVPDMLDLTAATDPGPFGPRTIECGTYLGIRQDGALVTMAGERMHPPGWTEVSAVCTAPQARGHGYASLLVQELMQRITDRGERPFLHATADNPGAIKLHERLGFTVRRTVVYRAYQTPGSASAANGLTTI